MIRETGQEVNARIGDEAPSPRERPASISAVVPMYRESANAAALLQSLARVLQTLADRFEIVVVNDGSDDSTRSEVLSVAPHCGVHYLELSRRFGKEAALSAGLATARGEVVVLLDGDGQHPVEMIPVMLDRWREGFDTAYGVRCDRRDEGFAKRMGSRVLYRLLSWGSEVEIPPNAGDFRVMDRRVVDAINSLPERSRFMKGLYSWVGFRSCAVEFHVQPRVGGRTSFSLRRLTRLAVTGITAFSTLPLKLVSAVGLIVSACSLSFGAWEAIDKLVNGNAVPGYATLVVSIMFFSGVQLTSIGILGDYVGRVFDEVKRRPNYIVADSVDHGALGVAADRVPSIGRAAAP